LAKYATVDAYLAALPANLLPIGFRTREIVDEAFPDGGPAIRWAHPTWSLGKDPVCYLKMATPRHLTFGFWKGAMLWDRSGRLETSGEVMAHVKLRSLEDIDAELFSDWVRQARDLAAR
jgi:hypothetical protein